MIGIRELIKQNKLKEPSCITVYGYLAVLNDDLILLDMKYNEDWRSTPHIKIKFPDLKYGLMMQILPLGGGYSMFFHETQVNGTLSFDNKSSLFFIEPKNMKYIENKGAPWKNLDLSSKIIKEGKLRYENVGCYFTDLGLDIPDAYK